MSIPDFTRADYIAPPPAPASNVTDLNDLLGTAVVDDGVPADTSRTYWRGVRFGMGHALVGCLLFALVGHWLLLGIVSIVVGILVGMGVMRGSGGVGGRRYQWTAVVLTYLSVSFASTIDLVWARAQQGHPVGQYIAGHVPFLVLFSLFAPLLELQHLGYGLLGLLILFFGLQAAWKGSKGGAETVAMVEKLRSQSSPGGGSNKDGSTLGLR